MKHTAHTPGPWTCEPLEQDFPGIGNTGLPHQRIVGATRISPGIVFGGLGGETDANARLIAAAPDLLALCKRALTHSARVHPDFRADLEAAIAKAEGA